LFRSVAGQPIIDANEPRHNGSGNGNGNGVWKRQQLTATAKRQRKNGNGMVETRHYWSGQSISVEAQKVLKSVITFEYSARQIQ